jgi:predicted anti-sigma-YlaC factor YlaD
MLTPVPPSDCAHAREAASARLDGELSELEAAHLESHLERCSQCRAYAAGLGAIAGRLRSTALEQPGIVLFAPRSRRPLARVRVTAAAVAVVAATGFSFAIGHSIGSHGGPPSATVGTTLTLASRTRPQVTGLLRKLRPVRMPFAKAIAV